MLGLILPTIMSYISQLNDEFDDNYFHLHFSFINETEKTGIGEVYTPAPPAKFVT